MFSVALNRVLLHVEQRWLDAAVADAAVVWDEG